MAACLGFHTGEMPMPGCHATPFQGHLLTTAKRETTFAPSYHFVTDLGPTKPGPIFPAAPAKAASRRVTRSDITRWQTGVYKRLQGR